MLTLPPQHAPCTLQVDHYDKDERYMSLSGEFASSRAPPPTLFHPCPRADLTNELTKLPADRKLDTASERKVVTALLERLEKDSSNDVQAIAVKCLSVLVQRVSDASITEICEKLSAALLSGSEELRDVYAIGTRAVITETPDAPPMASAIVAALIHPLVSGMAGRKKTGVPTRDVQVECFDISCELVRRFGPSAALEAHHATLLGTFHGGLLEPSMAVRKRATSALGLLAPVLSDALLESCLKTLLGHMESGGGGETRVMVQALGSVVRSVGPRVGRHTGRIVPLLLAQLGDAEAAASDESGNSEAANELRENVLAALESFFGVQGAVPGGAGEGGKSSDLQRTRGGASLAPFLPTLLPAALAWLRFDPNYTYEEGEGEAESMDEEEEEGEGGEEYEGEADGDSSWKARRAAARVLMAVVRAAGAGSLRSAPPSPPLLADLVSAVGCALVGRFREREEAVRTEVFAGMCALLEAVHGCVGMGEELEAHGAELAGAMALARTPRGHEGRGRSSGSADVLASLTALLPSLVPSLLSRLRSRGAAFIKTRTSALHLLRTLTAVLDFDVEGGDRSPVLIALGGSLGPMLTAIAACARERTGSHAAALRLEACLALQSIVAATCGRNDAPALAPFAQLLVTAAAGAAGDDYYRIQAVGMRLIAAVVTLLRPASEDGRGLCPAVMPPATLGPAVEVLCTALAPRLASHDIDTGIKEAALAAAGCVLAHTGDAPGALTAAPSMFKVIGERLKSETSRVAALRALAYIAASPLPLPALQPALLSLLPEFGAYLRAFARPVRAAAVTALTSVVTHRGPVLVAHPEALTPAFMELQSIQPGSPPLILSPQDLSLAAAGLQLCTAVATSLGPAAASAILSTGGLPARIVTLASSPDLSSGPTAAILSALLSAITTAGLSGPLAFTPLVAALVQEAVTAGTGSLAQGGGDAMEVEGGGGADTEAGRQPSEGAAAAARSIAVLLAAASPEVSTPPLNAILADATGGVAVGGGGGRGKRAAVAAGLPSLAGPALSCPPLSRLILAAVGSLMDVSARCPGAVSSLLAVVTGAGTMSAALALGGVVAGAPSVGMPSLVTALAGANPSAAGARGLLLALREALSRLAGCGAFESPPIALTPVLDLLLSPALAGASEMVCSLVAEAVGKAAAVEPQEVLARLKAVVEGGASPSVCVTAVSAVKHAVPYAVAGVGRRAGALSAALMVMLPSLLGPALSLPLVPGAEAEERNVTYLAALASLTALAYTAPAVLTASPAWKPVPADRFSYAYASLFTVGGPAAIAAAAAAAGSPTAPPPGPSGPPATLAGDGFLGVLTFACTPRSDLVREVDLGPFRHRVDDGTPARKAALAALDALMDRAPAAVAGVLSTASNPGPGAFAGMSALLPVLLTCAVDVESDCVMLAHGALIKAAGAGLMPSLLPSVAAADALADVFAHALRKATGPPAAAAAAGAGAGAGGPESPSSAAGAGQGQDVVRSALRALDAVARALPDAVSASRLREVFSAAAASESTRTLFASVRAEGRAADAGVRALA